MIEIKNLHKAFGQNQVLKGVDITVNKGDVVVVIGPSGSGKTTMLRCINFLERADEGMVGRGGQGPGFRTFRNGTSACWLYPADQCVRRSPGGGRTGAVWTGRTDGQASGEREVPHGRKHPLSAGKLFCP